MAFFTNKHPVILSVYVERVIIWLVSLPVTFVVVRLPNGKVTSPHVNIPSKARVKILKRWMLVFLYHAKMLVGENYFSVFNHSLNHPKAEKKTFMKPA